MVLAKNDAQNVLKAVVRERIGRLEAGRVGKGEGVTGCERLKEGGES